MTRDLTEAVRPMVDGSVAVEHLAEALDHLPAGVLVARAPSGQLVYSNRLARAIFGGPIEGATSAAFYRSFEAWHADGKPMQPADFPLARALSGERIEGQLVSFRSLTGAVKTVRANAVPIRDGEGTVTAAVTAFYDVSEAQRAEQERDFLAHVWELLSSSIDFEATLERVADLAVSRCADWCFIDLLRDDGSFDRVAVGHRDPAMAPVARSLRRRYAALPHLEHGVSQAMSRGEPQIIEVVTEEMLRQVARDPDHLAAIAAMNVRSSLTVPLSARHRRLGALTLCSSTHTYSSHDLRLAEELGRRASLAIDNALLFRNVERELSERARREKLARLLADASRTLSSSLDYEETLRALACLAVPIFAESCIVDIVEAGGSVNRVAVAAADPVRQELLHRLRDRYPADGSSPQPAGRALRDGVALFQTFDDAALIATCRDAEHLALMRQIAPRAAIAVQMRSSRGKVVGVLTFIWHDVAWQMGDDDQAIAEDLARRAADAVDNARLYRDAESAKRRAEFLQQVAEALSDARAPEQVASLTIQKAVEAFGARHGTVGVIADGGESFRMIGYGGPTIEAIQGRYENVPLATPMPITDVARSGDWVWFGSREASRQVYPHLATLMEQLEVHAWGAFPMEYGGRRLGAVALTFATEHELTDDERQLMTALARHCAQAFDRTTLLADERAARLRAEAAEQRAQLLAAASAILAGSRDYERNLRDVARTLIPAVADWITVTLIDEQQHLRRIVVEHHDPQMQPAVEAYRTSYPPGEHRAGAFATVLPRGRPTLVANVHGDELAAAAQSPEHLALLRTLGCASCVMAPIVVRGEPVGVLSCMLSTPRRIFTDEDLLLLEDIGRRAGQAIDNAHLFREAEQQQAELHRTTQTLDAVIRSSPLAMLLLDIDGVVRLWNPAAERIFGWRREEVLGRFLPAIPPERASEFRANLAAVAAGEGLAAVETIRLKKDGHAFDAQIWAAPVPLTDDVVQCLSMVADVSQRKALESERDQLLAAERQARGEAEAANRTKDEFLAMLGHELRNPLAPIATALHLMRLRGAGFLDKERGVIERQVDHLTRLVDDLLDVSRITRGKIELRREDVEVAEVVAKAIETASPLIEQRRHHLVLDVPSEGLKVHGDLVRLAQVVANVLTNSAKYTESSGEIRVTARRQGDFVELRVVDSGIGIDAAMLPYIFEPFVQERQAIDRSRGGLGLGLAIVKSLVTLHGGSVSANSAGIGCGCEILTRLPAALPSKSAGEPILVHAGPLAAGAGATVLIVDDNEDAAEMLRDSLHALGYATLVAHDAPAALRLVEEQRPDVALLDLGLPVMDGYELATRLRALPSLGRLRLIAVTGYGQEADRLRTRAAGFAAHLVKPMAVSEIHAVIEGLMAEDA